MNPDIKCFTQIKNLKLVGCTVKFYRSGIKEMVILEVIKCTSYKASTYVMQQIKYSAFLVNNYSTSTTM